MSSPMQQHGSKYFSPGPLPPHGHVVYQIKWNHKCSNMVENILPAS